MGRELVRDRLVQGQAALIDPFVRSHVTILDG